MANSEKLFFSSVTLFFTVVVSSAADAGIITFGSGANEFNMEFVEIGSPGNVADTTGIPNPAGGVSYVFQMGKFEVSREMITKANAAAGLGIGLDSMNLVTGGPRAEMPATGVTWNQAARFVNWLNTSQGFQEAYKFTTTVPHDNIAVWEMADAGFDPANPFRNSLAKYVLPTVDEWYKAAFFDPDTNTWFNFPNGSDVAPTAVTGGTSDNTAVFDQTFAQGPADINNAGGLSPFGVMGLGGNVWELQETEFDLVNNDPSAPRMMLGGSWRFGSANLSSSPFQLSVLPTVSNYPIGFRVASVSSTAAVPEPGSFLLMLIGLAGYVVCRWRRGWCSAR